MITNEAHVVGQDLHIGAADFGVKMESTPAAAASGGGGDTANPSGFDAMDVMGTIGEKDLWLDVSDTSIFDNDFPLPDFPCMSSCSSSSSTPAASKHVSVKSTSSSAASSSPAGSWAMMKSSDHVDQLFKEGGDNQMTAEHAALSSTASMELPPPSDLGDVDVDCIDVMENFDFMDLIDGNDLWDPSSVFQSENPQEFLADQQAPPPPAIEGSENGKMQCDEENDNGFSFLQGNSELAVIFFEWLKQNKDYISAEDMRSIKLKRSTIESASKRLGSSKEGKKQLLKLILEWVEQYQLQKKKMKEGDPQSAYPFQQNVDHNPNPNPNTNPNFAYNPVPDPNTCFSNTQWMPAPEMPAMVMPPPPFPQPMAYGGGDPYLNPNPMPAPPMNHVNGIRYPHSNYQMMEHAQPWATLPYPMATAQFSPYPDNPNMINPHQPAYYGNSYRTFDINGERLVRLGSSATKEARKKRMASQRRLYAHHHRHNNNANQNQNDPMVDPNLGADGGNDGDHQGNWLYWSPEGAPTQLSGNPPPSDALQSQSGDRTPRQASSHDRRQHQGWKTEKNMKFLLQKVLKQSDVGNLGRIVLPKKEAESHLPELETRDGISIAMEDIGTSRVWNMRYRFWPNNKSRMYLLENTGDFVRVNGLQEGDFIVIYSDTKCGKFMIRGVKVRQPGGKVESKKPSRRNSRNSRFAGNSSSLAPIKQAVR